MKDPMRDPFQEKPARGAIRIFQVAGTAVAFESRSRELLGLAETAFARMGTRLKTTAPAALRVRLVLSAEAAPIRGREPPEARASSCDGVIFASVDAANYALVHPDRSAALVSISPAMLRFRYHARYELIEFAVLQLIARRLGLLSLHAACLGTSGRCVLLLGDSGAGKSTACAFGLLDGLEFVAEDSVMVSPGELTASGVPAFLHLQTSAARLMRTTRMGPQLDAAPVIRRRSGVRKIELDTRGRGYRLASAPLRIVAVVALSGNPARKGSGLRALSAGTTRHLLNSSQPYAAGMPQWPRFLANMRNVPGYELRRGKHPLDTVLALRELLERPLGPAPVTPCGIPPGSSRSRRKRSGRAPPPAPRAASPAHRQKSVDRKRSARRGRAGK